MPDTGRIEKGYTPAGIKNDAPTDYTARESGAAVTGGLI